MTDDEIRITNQTSNSNGNNDRNFDWEERTAKFGEDVIDFLKAVQINPVTEVLIRQLVRSATSIDANYCEANDGESRKDFRHKIRLCRKESKESKHWLRMIVKAEPAQRDRARILWQEAKELNPIFSRIARTTKD